MVSDRIRELRMKSGYTQAALAKTLGLTRAGVNAWEMGVSVPSTQYLMELSRLFHVSSDFILGLNETSTVDVSGLTDKEIEIIVMLVEHFREAK